jgi:hypothetical protein
MARYPIASEFVMHEIWYYSKGRDDTSDVRIFPLDEGRMPPQTAEELSLAARRLTNLRAVSYFSMIHMWIDLAQFDEQRREILKGHSERFDVSPTYVFDGRNVTSIHDSISLKEIYAPDRPAFSKACDEARQLGYQHVVLCRDGSYMPFKEGFDQIVSTRLATVAV